MVDLIGRLDLQDEGALRSNRDGGGRKCVRYPPASWALDRANLGARQSLPRHAQSPIIFDMRSNNSLRRVSERRFAPCCRYRSGQPPCLFKGSKHRIMKPLWTVSTSTADLGSNKGFGCGKEKQVGYLELQSKFKNATTEEQQEAMSRQLLQELHDIMMSSMSR